MNQDTICAIATAQGGAIGCIRVSGPDAIKITSRIFTPCPEGEEAEGCQAIHTYLGHIHEEENIIDEVLVSLFRAPHSYTGEDSTEIMCHGSSYILQKVLQLLIGNGCRLAAPGEYTQRAFLGGKNGPKPGRSRGRPHRLHLCRHSPPRHEPDARWVQ